MNSTTNIFKVLADDTRLRVLSLFIKSKSNLCVCEIVDALDEPQYKISKALAILKNNNLLTSTKVGMWIYYDLYNLKDNHELLDFLGNSLKEKLFLDDYNKIKKRLKLRNGNICVVGSSASPAQYYNISLNKLNKK